MGFQTKWQSHTVCLQGYLADYESSLQADCIAKQAVPVSLKLVFAMYHNLSFQGIYLKLTQLKVSSLA